jgi:hypothetical protein
MLSKQLIIPQTKSVEKVKILRKTPEPQTQPSAPIKRFELMHRPFNLRFRWRLNQWLNELKSKNIKLYKIVGNKNWRIIKLYLYPYQEKWLTQRDVSEIVSGLKKYKIKKLLVESLLIIWDKIGSIK